jgi:dihydrofolate synthase/folylpolyglutamate synthase
MDLLGDTLEKVAFEKAGIIKKNIPVVISESHKQTKEVFISGANDLSASVSFADERYICKLEDYNSNNGLREYLMTDLATGKKYTGETILVGDYQSKNLQAVFAVRDALLSIFTISEKNLNDGIRNVVANTSLRGRWQVLRNNPLTICDTGHNKEGLEYVLAQIESIPRTGLHIILGFVSDKNIKSLLPLFPKEAVYYFTKASVPRALNELVLKSEAAEFGLEGESYPDVSTAFSYARKNALKSDIIFIGGSTFVVADVI